MVLISNEKIEQLENKRRRAKIALILVSIVLTIIMVTLCFIATYRSNKWAIRVNTVLTIILFVTDFTLIQEIMIKCKTLIYLYKSLLYKENYQIEGKVISYSKVITLKRNVTVREIKVDTDERIFYITDEKKYALLDQNIKMNCSENIVLSFEVTNE